MAGAGSFGQDAAASGAEKEKAESQQDKGYEPGPGIPQAGGEGKGVISAVKQNRIQPHFDLVPAGGPVPVKVVAGVEISHDDGKGKMPGNSKQGPCNAHLEPAGAGGKDIHDVFHARKAKAHGGGIDKAVVALIKLPAVAKEQPQHQEFGRFLRNSRPHEGYADGLEQRFRGLRRKTKKHHRPGNDSRCQYGKCTVEESLEDYFAGLRIEVLAVYVVQ